MKTFNTEPDKSSAKVCLLVHIFITHYSLIPLLEINYQMWSPKPEGTVDSSYKKSPSSEKDRKETHPNS